MQLLNYPCRYLTGLPQIFVSFVDIPRQLRYIRDQLCQASKVHTNSRRFGYKYSGRSYFVDHRHHYPCRYLPGLPLIDQFFSDISRQLRLIRNQLFQESKLHTNSRRFSYKVTGRSYFADHRHHYPCRILRLRFFIDLVASSS